MALLGRVYPVNFRPVQIICQERRVLETRCYLRVKISGTGENSRNRAVFWKGWIMPPMERLFAMRSVMRMAAASLMRFGKANILRKNGQAIILIRFEAAKDDRKLLNNWSKERVRHF
jgi:hypothetical protein